MTNSDQPSLSGERTYFVAPGNCPNGDGGCYVGPAIGSPNYEIIATDYDNYALIFSCTRISKEILYVLTRAPVDQAQLDEYLSIAQAAVPSYDMSLLNTPDVQGEQCTYAPSKSSDLFLH